MVVQGGDALLQPGAVSGLGLHPAIAGVSAAGPRPAARHPPARPPTRPRPPQELPVQLRSLLRRLRRHALHQRGESEEMHENGIL